MDTALFAPIHYPRAAGIIHIRVCGFLHVREFVKLIPMKLLAKKTFPRRFRKTFKIKACKLRGERRTSVRRSDEERRTTPILDVLRNRQMWHYLPKTHPCQDLVDPQGLAAVGLGTATEGGSP